MSFFRRKIKKSDENNIKTEVNNNTKNDHEVPAGTKAAAGEDEGSYSSSYMTGDSRGSSYDSRGCSRTRGSNYSSRGSSSYSWRSNSQASIDKKEVQRRKSIAKIYKDTSLTPKEKNDKIQSLLKEKEAAPKEEDDVGRRKRISSIFKDTGLSPKEKLERIKLLATENEKLVMHLDIEKDEEEVAKPAVVAVPAVAHNDAAVAEAAKKNVDTNTASNDPIPRTASNSHQESSRSGSRSRSSQGYNRRSYSRSSYSGSRRSRSLYSDEYSQCRSRNSSRTGSRSSGREPEPGGIVPSTPLQAQQPEQAVVRAAPPKTPIGEEDDSTIIDEEDKGNPRRRMICCICFCLILIAAIAGPLLNKYWDDITGNDDPGAAGEDMPSQAPTGRPLPTASPTDVILLYDPPTDAQCFAISRGNDVVGQNDMDPTSFNIDIDVAITNDNLDLESLVDTLNERMQERLAPALAGCAATDSLRRLEDATPLRGVRVLNERRFVIRNAKFNSELDNGRECSLQQPCFAVLSRLTLFLAGPEDSAVLTNRIIELFNQDLTLENLRLSEPFRGIRFVGVRATEPTNSPTISPSVMPSLNPSTSISPTMEPSIAPTIMETQGTESPNDDPFSFKRPIIEDALESIGPLDELNQHALDWLLNHDTWLPDDTSDPTVWVHRYAMYVLYAETCGHEWREDDGWLDPTSICDGWFGVTCDEGGDDQKATRVKLEKNRLYGPIPSELGLLDSLTSLTLAINELDGRLPSEIGALTDLAILNLLDTDLSGTIPTELGGLESVVQLHLDDNDLRGQIPSEFGLLTNLYNVSLWCNQLGGTVPSELGQCTSLGHLLLPDNRIGGGIPSELFVLPVLEIMELDNNDLDGLIPSEIGDMTSLTELELDDNNLSGVIPPLPLSLTYCDLERNNFNDNANALERGCKVDML